MSRKRSGPVDNYLSKREQQIMEVVFAKGRVSATDLEQAMPGSPSNSSVRTFLRILERKGHLRHVEEDGKYIYLPTQSTQTAARSALGRLVDTFFGGNPSAVVATLLSENELRLTPENIAEMREMIDKASQATEESNS